MTDFTARRTMMVDTQVRPSDVTKFPIIDAMLKVAREDFVPVLNGQLKLLKNQFKSMVLQFTLDMK